jgi:hypothetical protein
VPAGEGEDVVVLGELAAAEHVELSAEHGRLGVVLGVGSVAFALDPCRPAR